MRLSFKIFKMSGIWLVLSITSSKNSDYLSENARSIIGKMSCDLISNDYFLPRVKLQICQNHVIKKCKKVILPFHFIIISPPERWQSGRLRRSWKPLTVKGPGVRIPLSPPKQNQTPRQRGFLFSMLTMQARLQMVGRKIKITRRVWFCFEAPPRGITVKQSEASFTVLPWIVRVFQC